MQYPEVVDKLPKYPNCTAIHLLPPGGAILSELINILRNLSTKNMSLIQNNTLVITTMIHDI